MKISSLQQISISKTKHSRRPQTLWGNMTKLPPMTKLPGLTVHSNVEALTRLSLQTLPWAQNVDICRSLPQETIWFRDTYVSSGLTWLLSWTLILILANAKYWLVGRPGTSGDCWSVEHKKYLTILTNAPTHEHSTMHIWTSTSCFEIQD